MKTGFQTTGSLRLIPRRGKTWLIEGGRLPAPVEFSPDRSGCLNQLQSDMLRAGYGSDVVGHLADLAEIIWNLADFAPEYVPAPLLEDLRFHRYNPPQQQD